VEIIHLVPGNRTQPASEGCGRPQPRQLLKGSDENFLNQVLRFVCRNARQQNRINDARVPAVQFSEGRPISTRGRTHSRLLIIREICGGRGN
jgi:hypothetical protein